MCAQQFSLQDSWMKILREVGESNVDLTNKPRTCSLWRSIRNEEKIVNKKISKKLPWHEILREKFEAKQQVPRSLDNKLNISSWWNEWWIMKMFEMKFSEKGNWVEFLEIFVQLLGRIKIGKRQMTVANICNKFSCNFLRFLANNPIVIPNSYLLAPFSMRL